LVLGSSSQVVISEMTFTEAASGQQTAILLLDDFVPQPLQGEQFWFYNRLGGDRGQIDPGGSGTRTVEWGKGYVKATIIAGTNTFIGIFTAFNHPIRERIPLNFSAIFPSQIMAQYQGRVTSLRIQIADGKGTFQAELQTPDLSFPWRGSVTLRGGPQNL